MDQHEFEQFVLENGKNILRFCRLTCQDTESGDELYQDTMLKLLDKRQQLDSQQNVQSYALSISILLWKNKKNMQTGTGLYQWKAWMPWSMTRFLN